MRLKKVVLAALVLAGCAQPLLSDVVGEVVYVEGETTLVRAGRSARVVFGTVVENFDKLKTANNAGVEIVLDARSGFDGRVRVRPGSVFYVDLQTGKDSPKVGIGLLAGSVAVTVSRLAGNPSIEVRTEDATMTVRGTSFEVTTAVAGEILVTCESGRVEVTYEGGRSLFAEPGVVVEKTAGEPFRNVSVPRGDLAEFRRTWVADRIDAFKADPGRALRHYVERYRELYDDWIKAYLRLLGHREIIDRWIREERGNRRSAATALLRDQRAIVGPLLEVRRIAYFFERVYFRLLELEVYVNQGYGRGETVGATSVERFFRTLRNQVVSLEERMNTIRYVSKLFAKRNEGGHFSLEFSPGGGGQDSAQDQQEDLVDN